MMKKKLRFNAKYVENDKLTKGGRKKDSNYYRRQISKKKISYIFHLLANLEQLIIVSSTKLPDFKSGLIDRFIILAQRDNVDVVIIITKIDLVALNWVMKKKSMYADLGYHVILVSNTTKQGCDECKAALQNKKSAIVGHSGVGKTSLLNNIEPTYQQKVQPISTYTKKGRHTTTRIYKHDLSFGGVIYDMPGLKEIDFIDIAKRELTLYYPEFTKYAANCKYSNCIHYLETECAIKSAVDTNLIHPLRYKNYLNILEQLPTD